MTRREISYAIAAEVVFLAFGAILSAIVHRPEPFVGCAIVALGAPFLAGSIFVVARVIERLIGGDR